MKRRIGLVYPTALNILPVLGLHLLMRDWKAVGRCELAVRQQGPPLVNAVLCVDQKGRQGLLPEYKRGDILTSDDSIYRDMIYRHPGRNRWVLNLRNGFIKNRFWSEYLRLKEEAEQTPRIFCWSKEERENFFKEELTEKERIIVARRYQKHSRGWYRFPVSAFVRDKKKIKNEGVIEWVMN